MSEQYLFLGDSITCANRFWDGAHHGLGCGYVYYVHQSLSRPEPIVNVINKGFDGLTCTGLLERIRDGRIVLSDYNKIVVLIGINDIGVSVNTGVNLITQKFARNYEDLLLLLKEHTDHILCLSPFLFPEPEEYVNWYPELRFALQTIDTVCQKYQIPFYSLQEYFEVLQKQYKISDLTSDGIHLTDEGHRLLANQILKLL